MTDTPDWRCTGWMSLDSAEVLCAWAPVSHEAPAAYWLRLEWPCGHPNGLVPSCVEHTAQKRAEPAAGRATPCTECGRVGPVMVVAAADSAWNARSA
jgi:hypothetical protein